MRGGGKSFMTSYLFIFSVSRFFLSDLGFFDMLARFFPKLSLAALFLSMYIIIRHKWSPTLSVLKNSFVTERNRRNPEDSHGKGYWRYSYHPWFLFIFCFYIKPLAVSFIIMIMTYSKGKSLISPCLSTLLTVCLISFVTSIV